jgi:hypothetical protein
MKFCSQYSLLKGHFYASRARQTAGSDLLDTGHRLTYDLNLYKGTQIPISPPVLAVVVFFGFMRS